MSKTKKVVILSAMILLLAVTAVFNFVLSSSSNYEASTGAAYFAEYKSQRSSSRNEQLVELEKIIAEAEDGSEVKQTALTQKLQLTALTEKELRLESLIKAYGYEEVVVTMNLNSPNVSVVVKDVDFDQTDAVKIYTILSQETQVDAENVNIIPYL
ncbi:MAG: SpoIIIAH-like family protein [Clostridia bacterium]|nr:SpoIIIAH-like family protein [Clostridia bacterium]